MECMLSFEIFSMNVSSSPFLYFITVDSRGRNAHAVYWTEVANEDEKNAALRDYFFLPRSFLRLYSLMFTLISLTACRA